ncbi:LPD7 domain-containing protein [Caballeronia sordidicola]|jgi:hypothetical protein|uniref:Large polyvalent protein-associated domain-containing protein n=1 Tax=Caballeronia sordidicola TaxID=196367 RepID=A0A226X5B2_CABSO|nr:LPD7 domain-containing protein [Caballeronia sordidicola]OXC78624.1 hypothetical protein BSU04_10870 [Caballeronia sordidicola]
MLLRASGRHDGVKQYLESGRKQGRDLSRDELDERVVLAGDLELTDSIIRSIDTAPDVDRYLSVTMSFKEDDVDRETLDAITAEFRAFVSVAYRSDEMNFYAEAHLPKVKSYQDDATGELVERKPHIHVVIPKVNLISGGHLEPLGYYKSNIEFVEAFQEHMNAKYGLASPKDNRRVELTDASEMISRYKGDLFKEASRQTKELLFDAMLDRKIERYDDFLAMVAEHGETRLRNAGGDNEYANVKPADAAKGVNLKEAVFSRAFVELPTSEKLLQLAADIQPKYEVSSSPRETAPHMLAALEQWRETRALEVKYLNNGNTNSFPAYQAGSRAERVAMLAEREDAFYSRHLKDHHDRASGTRAGPGTARSADRIDRVGNDVFEQRLRRDRRLHEFDRGRNALDAPFPRGERERSEPERGGWGLPQRSPESGARSGVSGRGQSGALPASQGNSTQSPNGMSGLSGLPVDRFAPRRAVLVPDHALHQLELERALPAHRVRRDSDRRADGRRVKTPISATPTGRVADTTVSQRVRDASERHSASASGKQSEFSEIGQQLDARRLLAELSHSHGVRPEKYPLTVAKDGSTRIRAGSRHLNVSDFLTKELHLSWRDASQILRDSYRRQVDGAVAASARELPRATLWREFTGERDALRSDRQAAMQSQKASENARRGEIKQTFAAARDLARNDLSLRPSARRAAVSVARMARVAAEQALRAQSQVERDNLVAKHGPAAGPSFGDFLQAKAQGGDTRALAELRRLRPSASESPKDGENWILPAGNTPGLAERNEIVYRAPRLTFEVHASGDVTYRHDGRSVVRDQGPSVKVLKTDREAIESGLRLAQAKFGNVLKLDGPVEFQREAAKVAAEAGLYVEFADDTLNQVMQARRAELVVERANTVTARSRAGPRAVAGEPTVAPISPVSPTPAVVNPPKEPKR